MYLRHDHLPPWIRSFDLFRHRRVAIFSWGVHDLFSPEVCSWGSVSEVWCCPFFRDGWSSSVCIWISRLVFQRSLVIFLWLRFVFCLVLYLRVSDTQVTFLPLTESSDRYLTELKRYWILTLTNALIVYHTACHRRNGANFGRVFLMLKYTDITQNTYIQSWTVTEIMAREVWKFDSCYTLIDYQIHIETGRNMWFL